MIDARDVLAPDAASDAPPASERIRVLYVISGLGTGGAETMLLKLLQGMDRHRFSPMVVTLTTLGDIGPRILKLGIPVEAMHIRGLDLRGCMRLLARVSAWEPHVVHTWLYHADLLGGLAARWGSRAIVIWGVRSSNLDRDKIRWTTLVVRKVCAWLSRFLPHAILFNSEVALRLHAQLGYRHQRMLVIPNGFDLSNFRPDPRARAQVRTDLGLPRDATLVGMMARFDPLKNHRGFVECMHRVRSAIPDIHFLLAGTAVDGGNTELVHWIEQNQLTSCVHLLGQRSDMPRLMASLDVLVSPSFGEAFPNVVGEAMSCGVPCVVTDVGDSARIVADTGRVVPVGDMVRCAQEVVQLLGLPRSRRDFLGERARNRVEANYEISAVVRKYQDAYGRFRR